MNQMVEKLKALFQEQAERSERLRDEAYQDSLTGLGNRRYFEMQLHARLSAEDQASSGYLLLRVNDLAGLNQRLGGQRTDQLPAVAEQLVRNSAGQGAGQLLARSRGGEFILLAPGLVREEAEQLASRLDGALASLASTGATDSQPVAHMGLVPFAPGEAQQDLMMLADEALAQAERQADRAWACIEQTHAGNVGDDRHAWHALLDKALAQGRFQLFFQPVVASREPSRVLHWCCRACRTSRARAFRRALPALAGAFRLVRAARPGDAGAGAGADGRP